MDILVTGGAGFIGSHTVVELIDSGFNPIVIDNFANSVADPTGYPESLNRIKEITGKRVTFYEIDVLNETALDDLFKKHKFLCVIHFAGLKSVNESKTIPLKYYTVNIGGALSLFNAMTKNNVKNIIFSSSATVYGEPQYLPIDEKHPVGASINAYGKSKYFIEEILRDMCDADKDWHTILLRYFNPIGAHKSGKIGEDPLDIPNNLMPYLSRVAMGIYPKLQVFGNDYKTIDGTGVRDYIHVVDLARGHVCAVEKIKQLNAQNNHGKLQMNGHPNHNGSTMNGGDTHSSNDTSNGSPHNNLRIYNLGVGNGISVLELRSELERVSGRPIPYEIKARRPGDVASCYADPSYAFKDMGWKGTRGVTEMCEDTWNWQQNNPNGFSRETK